MKYSKDFVKKYYETYRGRERLYELALQRAVDSLDAVLSDRSIFSVAEQRRSRVEPGRIKSSGRLLAKASQDRYNPRIANPTDIFEVIGDIAGTRITSNTVEDVWRAVQAIEQSEILRCRTAEGGSPLRKDYISQPKHSGYRAVHQSLIVEVPFEGSLVSVSVEVQHRTLLQHAWGELTHEDTFKPGVQVPDLVERLSLRLATTLAVLDEIALDLRQELAKIEGGTTLGPSGGDHVLEGGCTIEGLRREFQHVFDRPATLSQNEFHLVVERLNRHGVRESDLAAALRDARTIAKDVAQRRPLPLSDFEISTAASMAPQGHAAIESLLIAAADALADSLDAAREYALKYPAGRTFLGTVTHVAPRHALVQSPEGDTSILPAAQYPGGKSGRRRLDLRDVIEPGDTLLVEVVDADGRERRVEVRPMVLDKN